MRRITAIVVFLFFMPACADVMDSPERKPCKKEPVQAGTCGDIDSVGRCDGATVVWCGPNNALLTVDCWDAGFEGCTFTGELYDCFSHQESFQACVERVTEECFDENTSGLCASSSSPLECEQGEETAAAQCVEDQVEHGACH